MRYPKINVTRNEMLEMRKQGLSNADIANVLEISKATVYRYIGGQGHHMESMAAFKETKEEPEVVETPEIKRAVDEVVVCTETLRSKSGKVLADVDYVNHIVTVAVDELTFDELEDFAVFIVGMVERIKGVSK